MCIRRVLLTSVELSHLCKALLLEGVVHRGVPTRRVSVMIRLRLGHLLSITMDRHLTEESVADGDLLSVAGRLEPVQDERGYH